MKKKLGDIYEISSGGTPSKSHPEYFGGDIPWVKTGDLKTKYLYEVEEYITEDGLNNSSAKMYDVDTVLIAMYGATIGATSILKLPACTNQACAAFKKSEEITAEYLYYFLKSKQSQFVKDGVGGAQPNISAGYLKKVDIEVRPISEQQAVVSILDRVNRIIYGRQRELQCLDEIIKARFIELFGDPIINTKHLETKDLKDVLILKAGDFTAASDIADEPSETNPYPCYGGNGIRGYVSEYNQDGEYSLIGRQGALSGNVQIASGKFKNTEHALLVMPIVEMNNTWLNQLLLNLDLKRYQTGAAQPGLSVKNLQEIQIISVPIDEQNQFADFAKQVNKSKVAVQKALDETQLLFDSLMQKYFG